MELFAKKYFFRILIFSIILLNIQIQWMFEKIMIFCEFKATSKKYSLILSINLILSNLRMCI